MMLDNELLRGDHNSINGSSLNKTSKMPPLSGNMKRRKPNIP